MTNEELIEELMTHPPNAKVLLKDDEHTKLCFKARSVILESEEVIYISSGFRLKHYEVI
jgi:hypothetical protein